jgi:hypothetical protein
MISNKTNSNKKNMTKSEEKINWKAALKIYRAMHKNQGKERKKKKKKLQVPDWRFVSHTLKNG